MNVHLAPIDILVLAAYVVCSVAFGLWVGRGPKNLDTYLFGGRNLPWWAILGSIVATETSTVTFLSIPGIAYQRKGNLCFLQLVIGYIVGRVLVSVLLLPRFFEGRLSSAYELLGQRFGRATQKSASAIFLVTRNLGDGLRLFLTAIVLSEVTNLSVPMCVGLIGVTTITYTLFGGMKSVVWNDNVQFVVYMVGGVIAAMVILFRLPDGIQSYLDFARSEEKLVIFDFRFTLFEPYVFLAGLIGGTFLTMGTHGTDQMMVQRYLCARRQSDAAGALIASGLVVFLQFAFFLLLGIGLAAYFSFHPPGTPIVKPDRAFARFIVHEMPAGIGIIGVVLAAVFSAAMSTLSSSLNSSASAVVNDFVLTARRDSLRDAAALRLSRLFTIGFGFLQIAIGVGAAFFSTSVVQDALAVAGFSAGLLLGVFVLAIATSSRQSAALIGLAGGFVVLSLVKFVPECVNYFASERPELQIRSIAWPWYPVIGAWCTFSIGWLFSLKRSPSDRFLKDA